MATTSPALGALDAPPREALERRSAWACLRHLAALAEHREHLALFEVPFARRGRWRGAHVVVVRDRCHDDLERRVGLPFGGGTFSRIFSKSGTRSRVLLRGSSWRAPACRWRRAPGSRLARRSPRGRQNRSNTSDSTSLGARVLAVDLVDHQDDGEPPLERLARARSASAAAAPRRRRRAAARRRPS
jgi:hypothetical protein